MNSFENDQSLAGDSFPAITGGSETAGRIHSLETLGATDGPGLRLVIFLQGCTLACRYCHNPDTWPASGGTVFTVAELVRRALRYQPFFGSEGGVTLSGGEPLLQAGFTADLLTGLQAAGLSTALDTSGWLPGSADTDNNADTDSTADAGAGFGNSAILLRILRHTDLVLLDIKSPDPAQFRWLTGRDSGPLQRFLDACTESGNRLWIRQVIVPGWNDRPDNIRQLADFLISRPQLQIERIELLPYHTLGEIKWQKLGQPYPLSGTPPLVREALDPLQNLANQLIRTISPVKKRSAAERLPDRQRPV